MEQFPELSDNVLSKQNNCYQTAQILESAFLAHGLELLAIRSSQDSRLIFSDQLSPNGQISYIGLATKSQHDYGHWGIKIITAEDYQGGINNLRQLRDSLFEHIEVNKENKFTNFKIDPTGSALHTYPSKYLAITTVTNTPDLFEEVGFRSIFEFGDKQRMKFMLRVEGSEIDYNTANISKIRAPSLWSSRVFALNNHKALSDAQAIVREEWGEEYAIRLALELPTIRKMPHSEFYGISNDDGKLMGIGAIIKSLHDQHLWSRAWIVISKEARGQGYGQELIQHLCAYADSEHVKCSSGPLLMEGMTYIPNYYLKYGNQIVAQSKVGDNASWTLRITPNLLVTTTN